MTPIDLFFVVFLSNLFPFFPQVGEMFIVCGVLYAIDSVTDRSTKIRLAMDLYHKGKVLEVGNELSFSNPFTRTTTVGYNHKTKVMIIGV
jgi:hypothetical protein